MAIQRDTVSIGQMNEDFLQAVDEGLSAMQKYLSSRYFYDEKGDQIFQQIMQLSEYYLTRSEFEIISNHKADLLKIFNSNEEYLLVDLGAGDGTKTKLLLDHFLKEDQDFTYAPVDISQHALDVLSESLSKDLPGLNIKTLRGEYFEILSELNSLGSKKKVILFLGSNIGNFKNNEAENFLKDLNKRMQKNDQLLIGFDLKKHPAVILDAYNDKHGVTKSFNLNLLLRINRELGANFNIEDFDHYPSYDPSTGETKSFLVSKRKQSVYLSSIDKSYDFQYGETIFMEVSRKFSLEEIEQLAFNSGFEIERNLFDCRHYFVDSIWKKKSVF